MTETGRSLTFAASINSTDHSFYGRPVETLLYPGFPPPMKTGPEGPVLLSDKLRSPRAGNSDRS